MKELSIDLETYSSVDLSKSGVYRYSESPDFEILLFGCSVDGGEVKVYDLASGEKLPGEILEALTDDKVIKTAFNASFERVCLSRYLYPGKEEFLSPKSWRCSMVWAATLGLPFSLDAVGKVLGLTKQKMKEGKNLIRYFCCPCKPTARNGGRTRNRPEDDPMSWEIFKEYNKRDVETEMGIKARLQAFPVPESEWKNYQVDQIINDTGVMVDSTLATMAVLCDNEIKEDMMKRMKELTGLSNPGSVLQLKGWLAKKGIQTDTLGREQVEALRKDAPPEIKEVLTLRLLISKSSISKYEAMNRVACQDGRARGLIQFYGASRTGRYASKLIQVQNLARNEMPDLAEARALVRGGDFSALSLLYDNVPKVLSELIRTAFIPKEGSRFIVADFSAIEARVIAWLAGESWREKVFADGKDIYCMSASAMFHVPVVKHGINGELRQKGKVAELACIAEDQKVLTDVGLIKIQDVTKDMKVWDGESWVNHEGVIYRGERKVITYDGLTATPDHLVYVQGKTEPVRFEEAATSGAHLLQSGNGRRTVRLGKDNQPREEMEPSVESLLCTDPMSKVRRHPLDRAKFINIRAFKGMSALFSAKKSTKVAAEASSGSKAKMRKSQRPRVSKLWRQRNKIRISKCRGGWPVHHSQIRITRSLPSDRPDKQQRRLCTWEYPYGTQKYESGKPEDYRPIGIRPAVLALRTRQNKETYFRRNDEKRNYRIRQTDGRGETEKLETHRGKVRVYDIRNAGPHHRYTVSDVLVHNCGYGGGTGALKAMGALKMGLSEDELPEIVEKWRKASPHIVKLWWDIDRMVKEVIKGRITYPEESHGIKAFMKAGILFLVLPSGRKLAYQKAGIGENQFGGESITYYGIKTGAPGRWGEIESYGPKLVENIVQATARDILAGVMARLTGMGFRIVMHIHDEVVVEVPKGKSSVDEIASLMGITPPWAKGLLLRADGYECPFYKKD